MEAAEVDQGVGAEEEVGDDGSDGVQLGWRGGKGGSIFCHVCPWVGIVSNIVIQTSALSLTNEDEANSDDVRQQVAPERFLVLAVTLSKESNERVELVLT